MAVAAAAATISWRAPKVGGRLLLRRPAAAAARLGSQLARDSRRPAAGKQSSSAPPDYGDAASFGARPSNLLRGDAAPPRPHSLRLGASSGESANWPAPEDLISIISAAANWISRASVGFAFAQLAKINHTAPTRWMESARVDTLLVLHISLPGSDRRATPPRARFRPANGSERNERRARGKRHSVPANNLQGPFGVVCSCERNFYIAQLKLCSRADGLLVARERHVAAQHNRRAAGRLIGRRRHSRRRRI